MMVMYILAKFVKFKVEVEEGGWVTDNSYIVLYLLLVEAML